LGAGLAHQLGASWTFADCSTGSPGIVILGAIVGLTLTAAGALESWRGFNAAGESRAVDMIAAVSLMVAALFALAILLPVIAAFVIPRCWL
jgi:hypothetical protein